MLSYFNNPFTVADKHQLRQSVPQNLPPYRKTADSLSKAV